MPADGRLVQLHLAGGGGKPAGRGVRWTPMAEGSRAGTEPGEAFIGLNRILIKLALWTPRPFHVLADLRYKKPSPV